MNDVILKAQDVRKLYMHGLKSVKAVDGVSIEIKKGKSMAIVGPSGAGKSTLLHLLGGLDKPTHGKVLLDNIDVYKIPDKERACVRNNRVGFVFQFYHLLPEFSALENVMLPALINGQRAKERGMDVLKSVGLEDRMNHRPSELSGGESQRVAIARALINKPEILLCDEPTGNLDSKTSQSIYELMFSIKSKANMALVIVTHDESISEKTEEVIRIKDGKII